MSEPASDAQALFERGSTALAAGEPHEAVECFTRAIALRPGIAAGYRYRAHALLALKDRARAVADFDRAIKLNPDDATLRMERAAELFKQHSYARAIADCDAVVQFDPARADVYELRGRCHAAAGDSEQAAADFGKALDLDPDHAAHYLTRRARLHSECGRYSAAVADADAALLADLEYVPALEVRATAHQSLDDLAAAAADFREAIRLDSSSLVAQLGSALVAYRQRQWDESIAAAEVILSAHPGLSQAIEVRGLARQERGDDAGAGEDFDTLIATASTKARGYALRGGLAARCGDYKSAARDLLESLKCRPRDADTFNQLAWVWATAPDPTVRNGARAKECATRACELSDWLNPVHLDTLAAACAERGEFEAAIKWQEQAIARAAPAEAAAYGERLALYQAGKPFRSS